MTMSGVTSLQFSVHFLRAGRRGEQGRRGAGGGEKASKGPGEAVHRARAPSAHHSSPLGADAPAPLDSSLRVFQAASSLSSAWGGTRAAREQGSAPLRRACGRTTAAATTLRLPAQRTPAHGTARAGCGRAAQRQRGSGAKKQGSLGRTLADCAFSRAALGDAVDGRSRSARLRPDAQSATGALQAAGMAAARQTTCYSGFRSSGARTLAGGARIARVRSSAR